jgi:hypothetical protein
LIFCFGALENCGLIQKLFAQLLGTSQSLGCDESVSSLA